MSKKLCNPPGLEAPQVRSLEFRLQADGLSNPKAPPEGGTLNAFRRKNMKTSRLLILIVLLIAATSAIIAQNAETTRRTLDIFYVDVEGGAATLIVTPA